MENTAFQLLGIENKELPVSNLLSYYLDPARNRACGYEFLNGFCRLAGIREVAETEHVTVEREVYLPFEGEHNYIDMLICIGNDGEKAERIICIENKINATEGIRQTKRYYEALQAKFADCREKDYIYLTKNNSSVNLSSHHFRHIRYAELGRLLGEEPFISMPLAKDFYDYYVLREQRLFTDVEENDRPYLPGDKEDFHTLIDYLVWKINTTESSDLHKNLFCLHGKSMQSDDHFFQLSMQNWEFPFDGGKESHPITIHLEGNCHEIPLHMELKPYEPYKKIEGSYGEVFLGRYRALRDELRSGLSFQNTQTYQNVPIRRNADLTIAKFVVSAKTYREYYCALMELTENINRVLIKNPYPATCLDPRKML
ncbi:MAG: PD-(D/E)XK nuclease family protein [Lachnospiraceae bacterium]|nr:PD-(D/E)XK nuclease family protein [Lachnospiraceae bacterium]